MGKWEDLGKWCILLEYLWLCFGPCMFLKILLAAFVLGHVFVKR